MVNKEGNRALAYVVTIDETRALEGYNRVQHARTSGWWCIVSKDELNTGDIAVYFEIDSLVPAEDERFAFMEKRNYRVKTLRMCKTLSQGLLMPIAVFPELAGAAVGDDVTEKLGVKYYVPEDNERKANSVNKDKKYQSMAARHHKLAKKKWFRWLMMREWGRKLLFVFFGKKKDNPRGWPTHFPFIHKTDETRIENAPWYLESEAEWVASEKLDGTSCTYILERKPFGKFEFYVLSRNVRQADEKQECYHDHNIYWDLAFKYKIQTVLENYLKSNPDMTYVCIQGEGVGSVQGNPLKLTEDDFYAFNFIDSKHGRWNSEHAAQYLAASGIKWVPLLGRVILPKTMEEMKASATGPSALNPKVLREGIVYRSLDGKESFKNVSNEFLLRKKD